MFPRFDPEKKRKFRPKSVHVGQRVSIYYPRFIKSEFQFHLQTKSHKNAKKKPKFHVKQKEIDLAFEFLTDGKEEKISAENLQKKLCKFFPKINMSECEFLVGPKEKYLTKSKVKKLFQFNTLKNYDPCKEVYSKIFDPCNKGFVEKSTLKNLFEHFGFKNISDEDLDVLIRTGDVNKDGKITYEDFIDMIEMNC